MSRRLIVFLVAAVVVSMLATAGVVAYFFLLAPKTAAPAQAAAAAPAAPASGIAKGEFLQLEHFVTDLADPNPLRYVDVSITLTLKDAPALDEAKKAVPQIRSIILNELRGRKAADLAGQQGQNSLAEAIKGRLSQIMGASLQQVFITDLAVQ